MKILLHRDYCLDLLRSGNLAPLKNITDQCEPWVLASDVPLLQSELEEKDEGNRLIQALLEQVSLISLTGKELEAALADSDRSYSQALAVLAVKRCGLAGVLTLKPEAFHGTEVSAIALEELESTIAEHQGKVDRVPILNIPATYSQIMRDVEQGMADVTRTGYFILGPKVEELEEKIADYCGCPHAVGVSSGTDALLIALMAADIGPGDEVITTPYTFFATAGSIARTGAKPVMVDIEENSFNIDVSRIEEAITPKTRALMPVHLYGQCVDMDPLLTIAKDRNLTVIEDAAQAIGAEYKGKRAGSLGDFGCFSFFPTKNLGGFGDAGIVTTTSKDLYDKMKILRVHGMEPKYYHQMVGGNFRIDALQAAVVSAKLSHLDTWTQQRRDHAAYYRKSFTEHHLTQYLSLPEEIVAGHIYNQFVIRVAEGKRDALRKFLGEHGVASEIYYPVPVHLQECFKDLGYGKGAFPNSEKAAEETLALPIANEVTEDQQDYVVATIARFFGA